MKSLKKMVMAIMLLLSVTVTIAQIKNAKTDTVKIFGNCDMCKTNIEKAGNFNKVANVNWDKDTKMAVLTYDSSKTNSDEILKRIALAGYDSEKFLAPKDVYGKLHGCCQYERDNKVVDANTGNASLENQGDYTVTKQDANQLKEIFDNYFSLKDALVKTDAPLASIKAKVLLETINAVQMENLKMEEHMVWMKVYKDLASDVKKISETQDIKNQRDFFKSVSKNMYELMKVSKADTPTYYQYCPMVKAHWLSKENEVKNPYYGSKMMTCGSTVETIK